MSDTRDEFPASVVHELGRRVNFICSNPGCEAPTLGPHSNPNKSVKIGKAAHISAAAGKGPRYDASMTSEQRIAIDNGIYLCSNCHELVDKDTGRFSVDSLRLWKIKAENKALDNLVSPSNRQKSQTSDGPVLVSINQMGGQFAHSIINNVPPRRTLRGLTIQPDTKDKLCARLIDTLTVSAVSMDDEPRRFAHEFILLTRAIEWPTRESLLIELRDYSGSGVLVLSKAMTDDDTDPLFVLYQILQEHNVKITYRSNQTENKIAVLPQSWP